MHGTPTGTKAPPVDSSRSALEVIHRWLATPAGDQPALSGMLEELAAAFAVSRAGLAALPDGVPVAVHPTPSDQPLDPLRCPWHDNPDLLDQVRRGNATLTATLPSERVCLVTTFAAEQQAWLLWLEDKERAQWADAEAAALLLAGQTLGRRMVGNEASARWAAQLDRAVRQQRLEATARIVRRLAHDFGNVLTGILGFSELSLAQQVAANTPLHAYLTEIHRGAQNGAQYINQLRLFARRQTSNNRSSFLASVLAEEETRLSSNPRPDVTLTVQLPADLPGVALDGEHLRQVLAAVLDNAREAIAGPGSVTVSARPVELTADEARDLFGDVRPGPHVEITVADTGSGLTPEAERQLFSEPFFSTKPRKRGFGLSIAYGILVAHRGGLLLGRRAEGGTLARVIVPVAVAAVPTQESPAAQPQPALSETAQGEKILVVDDDPMILQFVSTTLERAGFRVRAIANAEDALRTYAAEKTDPFRLVLSDVLMPDVNGVELAKRLLRHDANVRVLFMSGQVPMEFTQQEFAPGQFDLLPKPFRPESLVRAVRAALDRVVPRRVLQPRVSVSSGSHPGSRATPR